MRLAFLLVLSFAMAGCGDKSAAASEDDDFDAFSDFDLGGDDGAGVIRGVVVDESVLPIHGARIALSNEGREVNSNDDGAFAFGNVTAGTYFLKISKVGFLPATQQVTVEAGVEAPEVVKVQLTADAKAPYVDGRQWNGYVECSMSGAPICRPAGAFGVGGDDTRTVHDLAPSPTWVQSEMHWTPSQQVSDELWLWHGYGNGDEPDFGIAQQSFGDVQGPSPLVLATDAASAEAAGQTEAWAGLGVDHELVPLVFGGAIPESRVLCGTGPYCGGIGVTLEQHFTVYTHAFYRFTPPDGWVFTRDGIPTA